MRGEINTVSSMDSAPESLQWRKALRSIGNGNCVEVAPTVRGVVVRDSKRPNGFVIEYNVNSWRTFTDRARQGNFDPR